jgi:predicted transcriptional regulator
MIKYIRSFPQFVVALAATRLPYAGPNHSIGGAAMAFWKKKQDDFDTMNQLIQENPGISLAELARRLGLERSTISRRLPSLEESGYLYYEDDRGGLWPFGRRK